MRFPDYAEKQFDWWNLLQRVRPLKGKRILDCGFHSGCDAMFWAGEAAEYIAIDLNANAVAAAQQLDCPAYFLCGDMTHLQFVDESFDLVFNFSSLDHLDRNTQDDAIAEVVRVLINGGHLLISFPNLLAPDFKNVVVGLSNFQGLVDQEERFDPDDLLDRLKSFGLTFRYYATLGGEIRARRVGFIMQK